MSVHVLGCCEAYRGIYKFCSNASISLWARTPASIVRNEGPGLISQPVQNVFTVKVAQAITVAPQQQLQNQTFIQLYWASTANALHPDAGKSCTHWQSQLRQVVSTQVTPAAVFEWLSRLLGLSACSRTARECLGCVSLLTWQMTKPHLC